MQWWHTSAKFNTKMVERFKCGKRCWSLPNTMKVVFVLARLVGDQMPPMFWPMAVGYDLWLITRWLFSSHWNWQVYSVVDKATHMLTTCYQILLWTFIKLISFQHYKYFLTHKLPKHKLPNTFLLTHKL